jgi:hypothetical protein
MINVDDIIIYLIIISITISIAIDKLKLNLIRILFYNVIIYPLAFAVAFMTISFYENKDLMTALFINFIYSIMLLVPITVVLFFFVKLLKKNNST